MPLPSDANLAWPPAEHDRIFRKFDEWSAWYSGDSDSLASVYGARQGIPADRTSQRRGGVVGKLARWFWGQPSPEGQKRVKLHVPVAADIATASADLLFSEEVQLEWGEDPSEKNRKRLDEVLDGNDWHSRLVETAEISAALGGAYLRVTWDTEVADYPLITTLHADQALPEWRYGRLWAVTFWQIVASDNVKVLRHLERHEKGRIEHGLYEGTWEKLGRQVPLTESPITADITVDADAGIITGWDGLTAAYVPNIRPNRAWRTEPGARELGRSDYAGVEPLMDALDETYTSWMRDVRLGKARILIPGNMLETSRTPGGGVGFDMDKEVFTVLNDLAGAAKDQTLQLSAQQFAIRLTEHAGTAKELLGAIFRGSGYSAQTFGLAEEATATATEVHAREKRSMTTREKKTRYFGRAISDCLEAVLAIDSLIFRQGAGPQTINPEFPAAAQPSELEKAQSVQALFAAQSASAETRVKILHPEWDEKQIEDEVDAIMEEFGAKVENPDELLRPEPNFPAPGANGQQGPEQLPGEPPLPENARPGLPVA